MARKRKLLVPEAREAMNRLVQDVKTFQKKDVNPPAIDPPNPIQKNTQAETPQPALTRPVAALPRNSRILPESMVEKMIALAQQQVANEETRKRAKE